MTTFAIERPRLLALGTTSPRLRALAWRALRWAIIGYCLLELVSYAPTVDAKGHCDCPFFGL